VCMSLELLVLYCMLWWNALNISHSLTHSLTPPRFVINCTLLATHAQGFFLPFLPFCLQPSTHNNNHN